jgi:D-beta-D-heptose 7-phosphate kinase/D-beta-D-heptose 1-phosphate adenosyltransferase
MTLLEESGVITNIPTTAREVYDVTGAGDTVIATFTLALAAGASLVEAAIIANQAAGIVVGKVGTATVSRTEIANSIN